jgi:hypothetical protein
MYESVEQQIDVLVAFMKNKVLPLSFHWNRKKYTVNQVNMSYSSRTGRTKCYHFAVTSDGNYFKISFNTDLNQWFLNEAFYGAK